MQILQGIAVSPGVAIGEALIIDNEGIRIARRFLAQGTCEQELQRLRDAFQRAAEDLEQHRIAIAQELGEKYAAIFSAHQRILEDPQLRQEVEQLVQERHYSPEFAVSRSLRRYARILQGTESRHMADRAFDIFDIKQRLLDQLVGTRSDALADLRTPVIVLARQITPSEAARLDRQFVLGLVCETGGAGGHAAIVAQALGIPTVMGTGDFLAQVASGDTVIVDGDHGKCYLHPDPPTIERLQRELEQHRNLATQLACFRELPAETADGVRIALQANIEFPREVEACLEQGADGIGLYRTEFLYLATPQEPTEDDHYQAYRQVVQSMPGRPITIRTLDLGADKMGLEALVSEEERNPFLGLRSIRLALRHRSLFRTQLRALLRASQFGDVRIMFPLISTLPELRAAKAMLADTWEDLHEEGLHLPKPIAIGMMVEVPSSVILLDRFLPEVDFVSIGTNDLIQYALAVDRGNKEVASLYTPSDPAVLELIRMTLAAGERHQVPVAMCGQMSSSPLYAPLLLGMGLRAFSAPPVAIPELKSVFRSVRMDDCRKIADKCLAMDHAQEITDYLTQELRRIAPHLAPT